MPKDLYAVLGLSHGASIEEVKKTYRKLSKELHPDKHKGDKEAEQRFKEVNEAYEVLSNPKKKQAYDQFGTTNGAQGNPFGEGFSPFSGAGFGGFGDIFESFFGGAAGQQARPNRRGADREVTLAVELSDILTDQRHRFSLKRLLPCVECEGKGAEKGSSVMRCSECQGTGQVTRTVRSFLGTIQQSALCQKCGGSGEVAEHPCKRCDGEGRRVESGDVTVEIPAGISDGQILRVQGEGDAGVRGGPAGDLYVAVRVRGDARFERDSENIRSKVTVPVLDAILGSTIPIETLHGKVTFTLPEGTQPGQVFRIKGKGLPQLGSSRHGDHYTEVDVEIPKKLSRKERKILEEWKNCSS